MRREHGVQRKQQSVTLCVVLWRIFQTNGTSEFTGRTGSILQKWDAMKGGNFEPFMCRVMEHNHLFPEIAMLTTQNGDQTHSIDFSGHQLANHQAHDKCSVSAGLVAPFFSPGVIRNYRPRRLFPDLKIQRATVESSFTHDTISGDVWSSVRWYAMASLKPRASEIQFNHGSTLAGLVRTLLLWAFNCYCIL